jgi:hypothetical protein
MLSRGYANPMRGKAAAPEFTGGTPVPLNNPTLVPGSGSPQNFNHVRVILARRQTDRGCALV